MYKFFLSRSVINIIALITIVFGWWHVGLVIGIYGLFRFDKYAEIIVLGIIYDALFRMVPGFGLDEFMGTMVGIVLYISFSITRKALRK